jgi:hypothetical protein
MVRSRRELVAKWLAASESRGWVQNLRAKACEGTRTLVVNRVKSGLGVVSHSVILADRGSSLVGSSASIDSGVEGAVRGTRPAAVGAVCDPLERQAENALAFRGDESDRQVAEFAGHNERST